MSRGTAQPLAAARRPSAALVDLATTAAVMAASLSLLSHGGLAPPRSGRAAIDLFAVVLLACATVPLISWRRFPLGVFVMTAAAGVVLAAVGHVLDVLLGPTVALYLLAAACDRTPWTRRTTVIVVGLFGAYLGATASASGAFPGNELLHTGLAWAVAWFAGERTRLRREQVAEIEERAHDAERGLERERLLAAAEERARIARDLHDAAGHSINVIAVRAGAARLRHHHDPDRSLLALEAIEELARHTVEEIDHMVGTLREPGSADGAVDAPAGLASLDTLIAQHAAAGLEVTVDDAGGAQRVSGAADQAAYRILQEALTNAARHGAGRAHLTLAYEEAAVELTVTNPTCARTPPSSGRGHGLIGMRERATLLGGSLSVERSNEAFRVQARIPLGGPAPCPPC